MAHFLTIAAAPPLDPTAQDARDQLLRELSKPEYQSGKANWAAVIAKAIEDWISSLQIGRGGGLLAPLGWAIVLGVVLVLLVVAFLVFGLPRLNRRSSVSGALFGDDDSRGSEALRLAAQRAASAGDFSTAIAESFRAIARGMSERGVLTTFPGTTANGFATQAAGPFSSFAAGLRAAALAFDGVRYLGHPGTEAEWLAVSELEGSLRSARPTTELVNA